MSGLKQFDAAEPLLLEGYGGIKQREQHVPAISRACLREAAGRPVQLYETWGKSAQAVEWKQKLTSFDSVESEKKSAPTNAKQTN